MEAVFGRVLQMSMQAGIAIFVVLLARLAFQKFNIPKRITCYLWFIPIIRMICPVFFESRFSLIPEKIVNNDVSREVSKVVSKVSTEEITNQSLAGGIVQEGITATQKADMAVTYAEESIQLYSIEPMHMILIVLTAIWIVGIGIFLIYGISSLIHLHKKLRTRIPLDDGEENQKIYWADYIDYPFVYGFFRPQIYLPYHIKENEYEFVIAHERAHIKRKDHLLKIICYLAAIIHWFNPLAWVMLIYLCKDIEMACDEMVMQQMGEDYKADYAQILLNLSTGRKKLHISLAFGEGNTKDRILHILKYKNPTKITIALAVVVVISISAVVLTSPTVGASDSQHENTESIKDPDTENSETEKVLKVPDKNEVLEMQIKALNGMEEWEVEYLKDQIFIQNMNLEYYYVYENKFAAFQNPSAEIWDYLDRTGNVVIGYVYETPKWGK